MLKKLKNKLSKVINKVKSFWKMIIHPTDTIADGLATFEEALDNMIDDAEDMLAKIAALNLNPHPPEPSPS